MHHLGRDLVMRFRFLAFCLLMPLATSASAEGETWSISTSQVQCILDNREAYLSSDAPVIIIAVDVCPDTSPFGSTLDGLSNFGGVSNIQTSADTQGGLDEFISLTRDSLRCLEPDDIEIHGDTARLPRTISCED